MNHFNRLFGIVLVAYALTVQIVIAAEIAVPHVFKSGDRPNAAQFNENFQALATAVDRQRVPLGTVIASILSEDDIARASGDPRRFDPTKSKWVLADGREVIGSHYSKLSGKTAIPDLRGLFLRGKNFDRPTSKGNAEGNFDLEKYQPDSLVSHNHLTHDGSWEEARAKSNNNSWDHPALADTDGVPNTDPRVKRIKTGFSGGLETRPRNATVNYFVRIN